jgi:hypothetical protein
MNYEKLQFEREIIDVDNQCDDIFQYIFTDNHHKSIKKKCPGAG